MAELYAIVGDLERARFMLAAGVPYLQLRFKGQPLAPHAGEVRGWAERYPVTRIIVNDDLELALACGAWGAHLGQEDLERYTPGTVRQAPLHVGISTHSDVEIERALSYGAAMLGFGPVFATDTKAVAHAPQGVTRLAQVVRRVALPVIAIGGINGDNLDEVSATGVAMVAMIGYLAHFREPAGLLALMERLRTGGHQA